MFHGVGVCDIRLGGSGAVVEFTTMNMVFHFASEDREAKSLDMLLSYRRPVTNDDDDDDNHTGGKRRRQQRRRR